MGEYSLKKKVQKTCKPIDINFVSCCFCLTFSKQSMMVMQSKFYSEQYLKEGMGSQQHQEQQQLVKYFIWT